MKKFAILFCVLNLVSLAHSQPDGAPGLAEIPEVQPAPQFEPPKPPTPEEIAAFKRAQFGKLINPAGKLDLSSPENSVRSFVWAFWNTDFKLARQCVKGAQPYEKLAEAEANIRKGFEEQLNGQGRVLLQDMHSYIKGEVATVTFRSFMFDEHSTNFGGASERFYLRKVENDWLILPYVKEFESPDVEETQLRYDDVLAKMAALMANPDALKADRIMSCQMNLKHISLGIIQYSQDFDDRFPAHADWKRQVMPYIGTEKVLLCPDTKEDQQSYSFNSELENKLFNEIGPGGQKIMVYEGKNKEFEFRHRNQTMTNIAFADGHVKAFTRQSLAEAIKNGEVRW